MNDIDYMNEALKEAQLAYKNGDSPVGAVMVCNGKIIARAGNQIRSLNDPTAHAEILVIRKAGKILNRWKFRDCTIYTTIHPCPMCENAMLQAEIPKVVFGGSNFKWILKKRFSKFNLTKIGPLLEIECRELFIKWLKNNNRQEVLDEENIQ